MSLKGYPNPDLHGDCDVKYHYGYESEELREAEQIICFYAHECLNHLEYVGCVAMETQERVRQCTIMATDKVTSIILHGMHRFFSGQGIVFEHVQMMSHYKVTSIGGTIHIVANNQVGFTTDPNRLKIFYILKTDIAKSNRICISCQY